MPVLGLLCWKPAWYTDRSTQPSDSAMFPSSVILPLLHISCYVLCSSQIRNHNIYPSHSVHCLHSFFHRENLTCIDLLSPSCFNGRGFSLLLCYGLNGITPNSYIKALTPSVTILRNRAYRKVITANEAIKGGVLIKWDFHKEDKDTRENTLSLWHTEERQREDTGRRQPSINQIGRPYQKWSLITPDFILLASRKHIVLLKPPSLW